MNLICVPWNSGAQNEVSASLLEKGKSQRLRRITCNGRAMTAGCRGNSHFSRVWWGKDAKFSHELGYLEVSQASAILKRSCPRALPAGAR